MVSWNAHGRIRAPISRPLSMTRVAYEPCMPGALTSVRHLRGLDRSQVIQRIQFSVTFIGLRSGGETKGERRNHTIFIRQTQKGDYAEETNNYEIADKLFLWTQFHVLGLDYIQWPQQTISVWSQLQCPSFQFLRKTNFDFHSISPTIIVLLHK